MADHDGPKYAIDSVIALLHLLHPLRVAGVAGVAHADGCEILVEARQPRHTALVRHEVTPATTLSDVHTGPGDFPA